MRPFSRVGTRAYEPVQIMGGPRTRAIVQRPPDIDRPGAEFTHPTLTLRVVPQSVLKTGQVVRLAGGGHYLVTAHSETEDWHTHHLFRCDRTVLWERPTSTTDTVTHLKKPAPPTQMGRPWVLWERVRREFTDLTVRIAQETHLLVSGEDVRIDDIIEKMTVSRVSTALGVRVIELKG